jgi:hypothetical protein
MPNPFKLGDVVKTAAAPHRTGGIVRFIACDYARNKGGIKVCDKKTCTHKPQDYCWIWWGPGSFFSYHYHDLVLDTQTITSTTGSIAQPQAQTTVGWDDTADYKDDAPKQSTDAAYRESAKAAIEEVIKEKDKPKESDFFRQYYGLSTVRYDRAGRPYIKEEPAEKPPIEDKDIDWEKYTGKNRGPARKVGL